MRKRILEQAQIVRISGEYSFSDFDCGNENLNSFLKNYASQNEKKNISSTYLFVRSNDNNESLVIGYYAISTGELGLNSLSLKEKKKLPRYPVPIIRIVRLAIDLKFQKRGLGKQLLFAALLKTYELSREVGIYAVIVDAIDEEARSFYLKYNFKQFEDNDMSLYLPIKVINQMMSEIK